MDSSGNGRAGTVVSSAGTSGPDSCPGKVFLQKDLSSASPVCWKDQQNFAPFIDGIPPNTANYTQALRYCADAAQIPDHAGVHGEPGRQGGSRGVRQPPTTTTTTTTTTPRRRSATRSTSTRQRVFTVGDLSHLSWNSSTLKEVQIQRG